MLREYEMSDTILYDFQGVCYPGSRSPPKKKNSRRSSKDQNKMEVLGICKLIFSETVQKTVKRELILSNLFGVGSSNIVNVLHIVLEENRIIRTGVIGIIVDGCFP